MFTCMSFDHYSSSQHCKYASVLVNYCNINLNLSTLCKYFTSNWFGCEKSLGIADLGQKHSCNSAPCGDAENAMHTWHEANI